MFADPVLHALHEDLRAQRLALAEAVAAVPPALRVRRPAESRWSVAEVVSHLALVEARIAQLLAALGPAAPALPAEGAGAPDHAVDMARLLDRSLRFDAPRPLLPPEDADAERAWAELEAARDSLLLVMRTLDGRALDAISRPHPALGALNGYQWIASVAGHEARHAAQVREIGQALAIV